MKKIVLLISAFSIFSAFADQCQLISKSEAKKALNLVVGSEKVELLCELCGEEAPKSVSVQSIGIEKSGFGETWELKVNGKSADLAYTYVNGHNLAQIVGCEVFGASSVLR